MSTHLDCDINDTARITSVTISEAHNQPSASMIINAVDTALDMGDAVTAYVGYDDNKPKMFEGWVKNLEKKVPDDSFIITCNDEMVKATDFFIASNTPDNCYKKRNISAEDLVGELLEMAQITDYTHGTTYFTFGITRDVEVNLISSYDMCKTIADILAYSIWCDTNGQAHFEDRRPYVMPGDTSYKTISGIVNITHRTSERDLRNRVVVYGASDVYAVAEAESPYLPTGFRKTVVVASPWIDNQQMAQNACDYNLDKLNRLTEEVSLEIIGNPDIHARQVISLYDPYTTVSGMWYVYTCEHRWGEGGYTTGMELRK